MNSEFMACHFGGAPKVRESSQARGARVVQGQSTDAELRKLRLRNALQLRASSRNQNFGAGEGASLGAGL